MIETAEEFGTKVYYGDGLRIDLLRIAGAETAKVIAFCNDNEGGELSRTAVKTVLDAFPQAAVMVRAYDRRAHDRAQRASISPSPSASCSKARWRWAGRRLRPAASPRHEIERVDREYRMRDCERLERQSATGDLHAGESLAFSADRALPDERG